MSRTALVIVDLTLAVSVGLAYFLGTGRAAELEARIDRQEGQGPFIEAKAAGLFGIKDAEKHGGWRAEAEGRGLAFLYVCESETSDRFRAATLAALGDDNVFILDGKSDGRGRFVRRVGGLLGQA